MKLTKEIIMEFLSESAPKLMSVATSGTHPWIATVYFGFDDDLNLYFISDATTLHAQQISANSRVAVAIADSSQTPDTKKKGVQLFGEAKLIMDGTETEKARNSWVRNVGIPNESLPFSAIEGRMYKIAPSKIKYFNQALFEVEDGQEPVLEFS